MPTKLRNVNLFTSQNRDCPPSRLLRVGGIFWCHVRGMLDPSLECSCPSAEFIGGRCIACLMMKILLVSLPSCRPGERRRNELDERPSAVGFEDKRVERSGPVKIALSFHSSR